MQEYAKKGQGAVGLCTLARDNKREGAVTNVRKFNFGDACEVLVSIDAQFDLGQ